MRVQRNRSILLVDADESMLDLLKIALQDCGCTLLGASDGLQAMQVIQEQAPDLIVMELMLPVLDGLRLLRWLRDGQQPDVPVMVLTALDRPGICDTVHGLGVADLVYKPVGLQELLRRVRKLLTDMPVAHAGTPD